MVFNAVPLKHYLSFFEGLAPLCFRLLLALTFLQSGWYKLTHFHEAVFWFGNKPWGLGLPWPDLWVSLVSIIEVTGGLALVLGLGVRFAVLPLCLLVLAAIVGIHWENGWQWVAESQAWLTNVRVVESAQRLEAARDLLRTYGDYDWLTERGHFVVFNNGMEQSVLYLSMLISLLFTGGGRYVSLDYWIRRHWGGVRIQLPR